MQICYFFYKNILFGLTLFYFQAFSNFSGQTLYNDWFNALFNVFFTSLPVLALGIFEQDLSANVCLEVCLAIFFNIRRKHQIAPSLLDILLAKLSENSVHLRRIHVISDNIGVGVSWKIPNKLGIFWCFSLI